jgi:hypothetical protein
MFTKTLLSTFALLAVVNAIKVTSPDDDTEWSTSGSHTITWEAVSTDTESFQVVLDNQVSLRRALTRAVLFSCHDSVSTSLNPIFPIVSDLNDANSR